MSTFRKILVTIAVMTAALLSLCTAAYADGPGVIIAYESTGYGPGGGWKVQEDGTWKYQKAGNFVTNSWEQVNGLWYWFDANGVMKTGWIALEDGQYYLTESESYGHPVGSLWVNEVTPDGCTVDENGRMIKNPNTPTAGIERANPYGNHTCVEVVLSEQTIYVYQGPTLVLVSPCVTGSVNGGHATPAGNYHIYSKERNRTLRGTNNNGTKYASFVNFWMPFNGGIGLHDANWRSSFGGDIYVSGGSHGCVNMPYSKAEYLYSIAYVGMPVHVHN